MARQIKTRVSSCYNVANPTKVDTIDALLKKYKNKEHILFAKLQDKYETFPECRFK